MSLAWYSTLLPFVRRKQMGLTFDKPMTLSYKMYWFGKESQLLCVALIMQLKFSVFFMFIWPFLHIYVFICVYLQLDLCSEMAKYLARASTPFALWFPEPFSVVCCCFSNYCAYHLGILVGCNIGSTSDWFGCNNGWNCSLIGILFNYAVVENPVAKLKYVFARQFVF